VDAAPTAPFFVPPTALAGTLTTIGGGLIERGFALGRLLIRTESTVLAGAGVPSVHLVMSRTNTDARAFYDRLGFTEITVPDADDVAYLVCATG